jgi:hypothetical protein
MNRGELVNAEQILNTSIQVIEAKSGPETSALDSPLELQAQVYQARETISCSQFRPLLLVAAPFRALGIRRSSRREPNRWGAIVYFAPTKMLFGIMPCTPLVPSTNCVMSKSTAMLAS